MNSLVLMMAVAASAAGTNAEAAKEPWRDPTVSSINRLPARAIAVPCASEEMARAIAAGERPRTDAKYLTSLNGTWAFQWKHTFDAPEWEQTTTIPVPSAWQLQGDFDPAIYTNIKYPLEGWETGDPLTEPDKKFSSHYYRNPVGRYSRAFTVPADWKGRRVVIHFGGVSSAFYLVVNGKEVGYSEDSRLPAEFDITPFLKEGVNNLQVDVYKHCDGTFLEDQDFWRMSGIFRDVWLVAEQKDAPKDLVVSATLSDDDTVGTLTVTDESGRTLLEKTYANPKLWSCETPNLYTETVAYKGPDGATDYRAVTFGFRRIEIKDSVVYLNGKRLLIKGIDRHEIEPEGGYTVTVEGMKRDLEVMRRFNINAVRTSHYPNDPTWYELCDRAGIYLVCEANVEAHEAWNPRKKPLPANPLYHDAIVERNVNMVKTFRNHPSIIFWSLGNESGDGPAMSDAYKGIKALDETRPVQYESARFSDHSDIMCPMYDRPHQVERYVANNPKKPHILCEYSHAMGNSNGDIHWYTDLTRKYPSAQGGFIWDFADQAVWKTQADGTRTLAFGGDFGGAPNEGNGHCNGLFAATREPHAGAYEVKHAYQNISVDAFDWETKTATIWNGFRFLSLDGIEGVWRVETNGAVIATGKLDLTDFPADTTRQIAIPEMPAGDAVTFVFSRKGETEEIAHDQFTKPFVPVPVNVGAGEDVTSLFRYNFARALTDNDRGWKMDRVCRPWFNATKDQKIPAGSTSDLKATRQADGSILVDWTLVAAPEKPDGKVAPIPRVGLTFEIPLDFTRATWYGMGPWENYVDRRRGALLGEWSAQIGLESGRDGNYSVPYLARLNPDNYVRPGEQGTRTECRRVTFTAADGRTITVTALNAPFTFSARPYTDAALEKAWHQEELAADDHITVAIDAVMVGVGGDDSWGARPHDYAMLGAGTYRLQFKVEGL